MFSQLNEGYHWINYTVVLTDGLVDLVVKASTRLESGRSRVRIPLARGFFRGRVIPGTWRYRVSAGTGWPGASIL